MATRVLAEYGITARSLTGGYYRYEYAATDDGERVEYVRPTHIFDTQK
jgi:hypothetical protein